MSFRSLVRGTFWVLVAVAVVFHAVAGWYFSGVVREDHFEVSAEAISVPSGGYRIEEVTYQAPLGEFDAWYLPSFRSTWVIHVHGVGATPAQAEFLFEELQTAGYPQLVITYRNDSGQAADPSGYYQYGFTEDEEVEAAVSHARASGAERVVLSGFGAGGGHILSYMSRVSQEDVRGAILDSPTTDLSAVVDAEITSRELPLVPVSMPVTVSAIARVFTALRVGVNWKAIDYVNDAPSLRRPILVHHGTGDSVVPIELSRVFAQAAPDQVTLVQVEGAGHIGSYAADPEKYLDEIFSFLSQVG